jgi:predicted O-methyltransferase YrrM
MKGASAMRSPLRAFVPPILLRMRVLAKDTIKLRQTQPQPCDATASAMVDQLNLAEVLRSKIYAQEWAAIEQEISKLQITDQAGGVNPGDRRALYYLIRHLRPRSILEIGTHIGASTAYICAALKRLQYEAPTEPFRLTTVDITDVNDPVSQPWRAYGSTYAPSELVERLGCASNVHFVTDSSLNYLANCNEHYDLIFLDGDHSAATTYQEIPAALQLLNPGGWIVLHDYYPNLKPLWSDGALIPGPYMATRRLQAEGANISVQPLGELPWPTKLNSRITSLAVLGRA